MNAGRILATMALLTAASAAQAQTATQDVTFQVDAINQIAFAGSPSISITTAVAGSAPTAEQASGTWAVTTNGTSMKITAQINSAMPAGLTLTANLAAPTGGSSAGATTLSTTAADVVTAISGKAESGLNVTYELTAALSSGVVSSQSRTVTYTITSGS
ncbi:MAG: hypothetical protein WD801_09385 [Gemmatimonadaceae bacterium]